MLSTWVKTEALKPPSRHLIHLSPLESVVILEFMSVFSLGCLVSFLWPQSYMCEPFKSTVCVGEEVKRLLQALSSCT